jgi:hypothetical protein
MKEEHYIDQLFSQAAKDYTVASPSGAWNRIEASIAAKRKRRRLLLWWLVGALSSIASLGLFVMINTHQSNLPQSPATEQSEIVISFDSAAQSTSANKAAITPMHSDSIHQLSENKPFDIDPNTSNKTRQKLSSDSLAIDKNTDRQKLAISPVGKPNQSDFSQTAKIEINPISSSNSSVITPDTISLSQKGLSIADNTKQIEKPNETAKQIEQAEKVDSAEKSDSVVAIEPLTNETNPIINGKYQAITSPINKTSKINIFIFNYIGVSYSNGNNQLPNLDNEKLATTPFTKAGWKPNIGLEMGVILPFRAFVSFGFTRYNLMFKGSFSTTDSKINYVEIDQIGYSPMGYFNVFNLEEALRSKNYGNVDYLRKFNQAEIELRMLAYPINIGYALDKGRWKWMNSIGLIPIKIISNEVRIGNKNEYNLFGQILDLKSKVYGLSVGSDIRFKTKNKLSFGIKTNFNYSLQSTNKSSEFNYKPYSFLISPQIGFIF